MQKTITNSIFGLTNRFVGETTNLLGQQKNFVSSVLTIRLVNAIIFSRVVNFTGIKLVILVLISIVLKKL